MSVPISLSAIVTSSGRPDEIDGILANLLNQDRPPDEIILFDTSERGTGRQAERSRESSVRYFCADEDPGPIAARNLAAREARGDLLLFLYDYLRFDRYHATNTITNAFRPPEIACLAFQVRNAASRELIPDEFPAVKPVRWTDTREVSSISPSAFAIRRSVFTALGGFDETLFGGEEGIDLAYRAIKAGGAIHYLADIMVHLRASMRDPELFSPAFRSLHNRVYLAMKHLPAPLVISHSLAWAVYSFALGLRARDAGATGRAIDALTHRGGWERARAYRRANPPRWAFVDYLRKHEGRVLY